MSEISVISTNLNMCNYLGVNVDVGVGELDAWDDTRLLNVDVLVGF